MKRTVSLLLAVCLALGAAVFSSCGSKAEPTKPTNVFRTTEIELPEELKSTNVSFGQMVNAGDTLYTLAHSYDMETYMPRAELVSFDLASGTLKERIPIEIVQDENGGENLMNFAVAKDGTAYFMFEKYTYSDDMYTQVFELRTLRDGEFSTLAIDLETEDGYGFYVNSMLALDDGSLLLVAWNGMRILTPDGTVKAVEGINPDETNIERAFLLDGKVYVSMYTYSENNYGSSISEFDPVSGTFGEKLEINQNHVYSMIFGPGYDYYYNDRNCLWGVDIETGEMTEIVNFINSDINGNDINDVVALSADRFVTTMRELDLTTGMNTMGFAFIDRVPDDEVVPKNMLRLAVNYSSYELRSRVIDFNKKNDTYRIVIDDYSRFNTDENYGAGVEKLNSDIISGNVPDIFMINNETPYDVYAAKGIFADIYELMDKDESFDRSKYLENIFKAYEYNGELLSLVPSFTVQTFAAKKDLLGGIKGWNFKEFTEFAAAHPEIRMFDYEYNREYFVRNFMLFARDQFIDAETGICSFDSPEFRELLTFAASLEETDFWSSIDEEDQMSSDFWQEFDNRFKEGRVLLSNAYINEFEYSFKNLLSYTFGGDIEFVGFPVSEGNGALIEAYTEYAIAADSDFKEGAWEFLKTTISEEAQMPVFNEQYQYWNYPAGNLPIYKPALEKMAEIAMTPREDSNGGVIIGGGIATLPAVPTVLYSETASAETEAPAETVEEITTDESADTVNDVTVEIAPETMLPDIDIAPPAVIEPGYVDPYSIPLTEDQVETLMELITGTTCTARYDEELNNIISEELEPFFAGNKFLDDTVRYIQDRVTKYINESR